MTMPGPDVTGMAGQSTPVHGGTVDPQLLTRYKALRTDYARRDVKMAKVLAVREGRYKDVAPELFPESGILNEAMVANLPDIAARDMAEQMSPLPTFQCWSPHMESDREQKRAAKRTRIVLGYLSASNVPTQLTPACDMYISYGVVYGRVQCDWDAKMPKIRLIDPTGVYPVKDAFGTLTAVYQHQTLTRYALVSLYPELAHELMKPRNGRGRPDMSDIVSVVFYHDKDWDLVFLPNEDGLLLSKAPNPAGKVMWREARQPTLTKVPRGNFDDVIAIQLAKAKYALLELELADRAVHSPLRVPMDMTKINLGPDAVLKSSSPESISYMPPPATQSVIVEQQSLDQEVRVGSRYPQTRTGNGAGSIVTGNGVRELEGGFDGQIKAAQGVLAPFLRDLVQLCLEVDDTLFKNDEKTLNGSNSNAPFLVTYTPSKDINNDYTVYVRYEGLAGMDPNRALVWGIQAEGAGIISKQFLRTNLPVDIDAQAEAKLLDVEAMRSASQNALQGLIQSMPVLVEQGQDPTEIIRNISEVIKRRQKGDLIEDIMIEVFAKKPQPVAPAASDGDGDETAPPASDPGSGDGPGGEIPQGLSPTGTLQGVPLGQQGSNPGGRPTMEQLLAGLSSSGQPNLSANIVTRRPV